MNTYPASTTDNEEWTSRKEQAAAWFKTLQSKICEAFEDIEKTCANPITKNKDTGRFENKKWSRPDSGVQNISGSILNGGGYMATMRGRIFEKVGVNVSEVWGTFSPEFANQIPGAKESNGAFWASGISLVAHMASPLVPAVHMNTRMIVTSKGWFGGGADLTPMFIPDDKNAEKFHSAFESCCNKHNVANYQEYKEWCDKYFYLPHREEARGIGGIFYDYLDSSTNNPKAGGWNEDFAFTKDVGKTFLDVYNYIVNACMNEPWTPEQREHQLIRRGRYVEFNLLYDRGTQFGLKTGGNTEAILMSMPPEVKWP